MNNIVSSIRKTNSTIKFLFLAILLVRIVLILQPSFKIDMGDWQAWTGRLLEVGPLNFYTPNFFADYFPFFYLLLWGFGKIFAIAFGNSAVFSSIFEVYIKLISNIFDFATAYFIFLIIKKHSSKWAVWASYLYLINPSIIFNTSVWGQIDSIPTFLFIYSLYFLEEKKNLGKWTILSVFSFLIKPLNVSSYPLLLIRIIKDYSVKKIVLALLFSTGVFLAIVAPFFPKDPIFGAISHFLSSLNTYPYTSLNAYNFWGIFGFWKPDNGLFLGVQFRVIGYALFLTALLMIIFPYVKNFKNNLDVKLDYFALALCAFAFFLFLTRIHERHLFPLFALLVVSAAVYKSKTLFIVYGLLAVVNFINLYYSYYYYNVVYGNPLAQTNIIFTISSNFPTIFSVFSVFLFGVMLVIYYEKSLNK